AVAVGILGQRAALGIHLVAGRRVLALVDVIGHTVAVAVFDGTALGVDLVARRRVLALVHRVGHAVAVLVAHPGGVVAQHVAQAGLDAPVEVVARAVVGRRDVVSVDVH